MFIAYWQTKVDTRYKAVQYKSVLYTGRQQRENVGKIELTQDIQYFTLIRKLWDIFMNIFLKDENHPMLIKSPFY